jgi:hypothetical protein
MFKIGMVGGPCGPYIEKSINSIINQKESNWALQIVLDPIDDSYNIAKKYENDKIKVIQNDIPQKALYNHYLAFSKLNCHDEDIIITMDADDWLFSNDSLSIVQEYYDRFPETLVTHGSWIGYPDSTVKTNCLPYTIEDWNKGIRNVMWKATQLRTIKYKLWKNIDIKDFKDENNNFFKFCGDLAYMFPSLEMAGPNRVKFISEIIYVYNQETLFSEIKIDKNLQKKICYSIRSKKPYQYKIFK